MVSLTIASLVGVVAALCVAATTGVSATQMYTLPVSRGVHHTHPRQHPVLRRRVRDGKWLEQKADGVDAQQQQNFALGGDVWPVAIFWVDIQLGTPKRHFPVAIDSGSDTLDIPSAGCRGCVHQQPNNQYDHTASSTSAPIPCSFLCQCDGTQCGFSNTYQTCDLSDPTAPCTITGKFWQDEVSMGALGPVNVTFGGIESQTSNFDQFKNIDGVMGLAGPDGNQNVFSSLFKAGKLKENKFAMCFHQGAHSNGTMTIGGTDPQFYHGEIKYVTNTGGSFSYGMDLLDIVIDGQPLGDTSTNQAILDSGTNVLLVPTPAFSSFTSIVTGKCATQKLRGICDVPAGEKSLLDGGCFAMTQQEVDAFPPIELKLNGVTLKITGQDYLNLGRKHAPEKRCFGIRPTGQNGFLIIGDTIMERYYVVFDRAAGQIGWADVNTKTCGHVPAGAPSPNWPKHAGGVVEQRRAAKKMQRKH